MFKCKTNQEWNKITSITMHGQYFLQRFLLLSSKLESTMAPLGQEWSKRARMGAMDKNERAREHEKNEERE